MSHAICILLKTDLALAIMPDYMLASISHVLVPVTSDQLPVTTTPRSIRHNKELQRDSFRLTLGWPMLFDPPSQQHLCAGTIAVS